MSPESAVRWKTKVPLNLPHCDVLTSSVRYVSTHAVPKEIYFLIKCFCILLGGTRYIKAFKKAFEVLRHTLTTSSQKIVSRPSMVLLLTNDGPEKKGVQELVMGAVKEEFQRFRNEFKETSLKLLIMNFGKEKKFFDELADATVGME